MKKVLGFIVCAIVVTGCVIGVWALFVSYKNNPTLTRSSTKKDIRIIEETETKPATTEPTALAPVEHRFKFDIDFKLHKEEVKPEPKTQTEEVKAPIQLELDNYVYFIDEGRVVAVLPFRGFVPEIKDECTGKDKYPKINREATLFMTPEGAVEWNGKYIVTKVPIKLAEPAPIMPAR